MPFEPKIIAFLCTWCSYTGADTAGIARLKSPANIRAIRVPCSGRVSPEIIMRTFDQGADGVLVLGCHIGECHYDSGNHRTAKRIPILHALMTFAGLEPERLRLDWVSASEGERFSRITTEFTEAVRALGPVKWRVGHRNIPIDKISVEEQKVPTHTGLPSESGDYNQQTQTIRLAARDLLSSGQVDCVIGYEVGPRGYTRPAFIHHPEEVERLVWNQECTHNLTTYLSYKLNPPNHGSRGKTDHKPSVAVVVKPCDSRAINVLLAENRFSRDQVHVIGVVCDGIYNASPSGAATNGSRLQTKCQACVERVPVVYDTLVGEATGLKATQEQMSAPTLQRISNLDHMTPAERMEFWLSQFDRCIRCYACRQACPMCDCSTCLYERDDSLWVGMGIGVNEKRAFHLGRAFHLAGRCVGCDECERVCPMNIPISLLNHKLSEEVSTHFGYHAGLAVVPTPFVTILGGEES